MSRLVVTMIILAGCAHTPVITTRGCLTVPPPEDVPLVVLTDHMRLADCPAKYAICLLPDDAAQDSENVRALRSWTADAWQACSPAP